MKHPGIYKIPALLLLIAFAGCDRAPEAAATRQYEVRGIVRAPVSKEGAISVEHEDIAGLMPSMTMPFKLGDVAEGADLKPGDAVTFTLVLGNESSHIAGIRKIDPASVNLPKPEPRPAGAGAAVKRVKEGDMWPAFKLVDQNGRELASGDFTGVLTLVDFIFTRCAVPNYCPLMTENFSQIESALSAASENDRVRLLSVSFDPVDTPEVLSQYAQVKKAGWTFATGEPGEIDRLTKAFGVRVEEEGGTLNHGLCTALIGPDGKILQIWRGNQWKPQEVLESIRTALQTPQY